MTVQSRRVNPQLVRYDWSLEELREVHWLPFPDLILNAQKVHRDCHDPLRVQLCTLLSIKTGGCPEDCAYCPQSSHYSTPVESEAFLSVQDVLTAAERARAGGSTRFCLGAAWREAREGPHFDRILQIVKQVRQMGLEVCCTLGMLTARQASRLAEAGLTAYNHNLDTAPEYYGNIITTRTYQDRLQTIRRVAEAGIALCCGGIIGMGESIDHRLTLLQILSSLKPHPESVPINALVAVAGTPLESQPPVDPLELVRMIATARIVLPASRVRLSAGRKTLSPEGQALCFLAGANSIFTGEKLLTTPNPSADEDLDLLRKLGMRSSRSDEPLAN